MRPRNLCRHRLHKFFVRVGSCKLRHIFKISHGIAFDIRESNANICGKIFNKLAAPSLMLVYDRTDMVVKHILLPENLIKQGMYLFSLGEKIECLNKIYFPGVYKRFDALADFLGCSKKALAIRMKQLGLLKKEYLDNPFDLVTVYPEVSEL